MKIGHIHLIFTVKKAYIASNFTGDHHRKHCEGTYRNKIYNFLNKSLFPKFSDLQNILQVYDSI